MTCGADHPDPEVRTDTDVPWTIAQSETVGQATAESPGVMVAGDVQGAASLAHPDPSQSRTAAPMTATQSESPLHVSATRPV